MGSLINLSTLAGAGLTALGVVTGQPELIAPGVGLVSSGVASSASPKTPATLAPGTYSNVTKLVPVQQSTMPSTGVTQIDDFIRFLESRGWSSNIATLIHGIDPANWPSEIKTLWTQYTQFKAQGEPALGVKPGGYSDFGAIVTSVRTETVSRAPKGYVTVKDPVTGQKVAVLKEVARAEGLWKPRKKPPISAGDWNKLKTAKRVHKKAEKIAKEAGFHVYKEARTRGSRSRSRSRAK